MRAAHIKTLNVDDKNGRFTRGFAKIGKETAREFLVTWSSEIHQMSFPTQNKLQGPRVPRPNANLPARVFSCGKAESGPVLANAAVQNLSLNCMVTHGKAFEVGVA